MQSEVQTVKSVYRQGKGEQDVLLDFAIDSVIKEESEV